MKEQYQQEELNISSNLKSFSDLNKPVGDKENEIETRIGKIIGLENAAIKILRQVASINRKRQKPKLHKNMDTKSRLNFQRRKTQKLVSKSLHSQDNEVNNNKIDKIAIETEKMALMNIRYLLI